MPRTAADRAELRAKREGTQPHTTQYTGEVAYLRLLGHVGVARVDRAGVVTFEFPPAAKADAERFAAATRRVAFERHEAFRASAAARNAAEAAE